MTDPPPTALRPQPPPAAAAAVRALFGGLARVRRDRAVHPKGVVLRGTLRASGSGVATSSELLSSQEEWPALVRFSRGAGLPDRLPDVLGCAVRVPDAYGGGLHQDFVLASSGVRPLARHALLPGRRFSAAFYSSVLLYRIGEETRLVGARLEAGRLVRLLLASPLGRWTEVARIDLDRQLPPGEADRLRFNPWHSGGGIRPIGPLMGLRDPAYRGSQAAAPPPG